MFFDSFFKTIKAIWPFLILFGIPLIVFLIYYVGTVYNYKRTSYYKITHTPYFALTHNTGAYGEYQIYSCLKQYESEKTRFLFNVYIPKKDGTTTEIDVLMICDKGIYVFESKNLSGWIFGNENHKEWYQTLKAGKGRSIKECFYNPILQNKGHIESLKTIVGSDIPMFSFVVFSVRCELKDVTYYSSEVHIVKRNELDYCVITHYEKMVKSLTQEEIDTIYTDLYQYTQVDEIEKQKHIKNLLNKSQDNERKGL